MSNSSGMFKLKPLYNFDETQISLPDCMFKMQNYHSLSYADVANKANLAAVSDDPALAELEQRQLGILNDLQSLESQVADLTTKIQPAGPAATSAQPTTPATTSTQRASSNLDSNGVHDIVIYANPNNPPYSLLVLYEQLKQQFRCMTKVHLHSSVTTVSDKLLQYFQNGAQPLNRWDAQLSLTLIWKNVTQGPEMKVKAGSQTAIQGEVNILRYLSRLLTPAFDASDIVTLTSVDTFLDLASSTILNGNTKEKAAAVRTLNAALGKRTWLVADSPTVADVAIWSTLQQTGLAGGAPSNVQKWLKACAARNEFRTALNAVA